MVKRVSHIDPSTLLKAIMRCKHTAKRILNPAGTTKGKYQLTKNQELENNFRTKRPFTEGRLPFPRWHVP